LRITGLRGGVLGGYALLAFFVGGLWVPSRLVGYGLCNGRLYTGEFRLGFFLGLCFGRRTCVIVLPVFVCGLGRFVRWPRNVLRISLGAWCGLLSFVGKCRIFCTQRVLFVFRLCGRLLFVTRTFIGGEFAGRLRLGAGIFALAGWVGKRVPVELAFVIDCGHLNGVDLCRRSLVREHLHGRGLVYASRRTSELFSRARLFGIHPFFRVHSLIGVWLIGVRPLFGVRSLFIAPTIGAPL
jgi:hypothetical protein